MIKSLLDQRKKVNMEIPVAIIDHNYTPIEEIIHLMSKINLFPRNKEWRDLFSEEGQVIFETKIKDSNIDLIIHFGTASYYIDIIVEWDDFDGVQKHSFIVWINTLIKLLKSPNEILIVNETKFGTIYDSVCDGLNLNEILVHNSLSRDEILYYSVDEEIIDGIGFLLNER
jgi:hypothetical protein